MLLRISNLRLLFINYDDFKEFFNQTHKINKQNKQTNVSTILYVRTNVEFPMCASIYIWNSFRSLLCEGRRKLLCY